MNRSAKYRFRLFVADNAQNSVAAVANLTALCKEYLPHRHEIEVIDVFKEPERALAPATPAAVLRIWSQIHTPGSRLHESLRTMKIPLRPAGALAAGNRITFPSFTSAGCLQPVGLSNVNCVRQAVSSCPATHPKPARGLPGAKVR